MTQPNIADETAAPSQPVGTAKTGTLAVVNLLPPEIYEAARFRRLQLGLGCVGLAAVAVVGALTYQAHHSVAAAKERLTQAQTQETTLQSQLNGLQSVRDVYAQVAAKKAMLTNAMGNEVRWSTYLTDLSLRVPANVWLTNLSATESVPGATGTVPAAGAPGAPSPLLATGIGTVQFSGVAFSHDDVATWLDALAKEKGFTNVYFSSSTKGTIGARPVVNFVSQVTLSQAALSGRYLNASEG
ncbi:MAG: type pilus assembly protein PilN [Frankiaceae bacterium]|jgi:Tfp pilus assembly protein PilN|nr:type pilus assembly protein PilN [Frankiaceae bacterium]